MPVMLDVLMPQGHGGYKTLYLLHGAGGDHACWTLKTRIADYVEGKDIAVVMPSGNNRFYVNNVNGKDYFSFIADELINNCETWFNISRNPEDRVPTDSEKAACEEYLLKQIETIDPKIMIFCGATALKSFYPQKTAISKIRGEVLELEIGGKKRKCIPIFHPSYLLRYHSLEEGSPRDLMLKDLKKIQDLIKV